MVRLTEGGRDAGELVAALTFGDAVSSVDFRMDGVRASDARGVM